MTFRLKRTFVLTVFSTICSLGCIYAAASCPSQSAAPQSSVPAQEFFVEAVDGATLDAAPMHHRAKIDLRQEDIVRLSEALGHLIGRNLENPSLELDLESIIKGMRDAAAGRQAPMSDEEYELMMSSIQESAFNDMSRTNLEEANEFLKRNAQTHGIVEVVPGKLQYSILAAGNGDEVSNASIPQIAYIGSFADGTVFGSSEDTGGPVAVALDQAIPGFSQGVVGMKVGEKRRIYIHPDLGYGVSGHLPPNSLLVFEVEVVSIDNQHPLNAPIADSNNI